MIEDKIAINEENFPDEAFRRYISENFDTDGDGFLSQEEVCSVKGINVENCGIKSLKGVELFTELEVLWCDYNKLKELNVSKNVRLECLSCGSNKLTSLDISKNTKLEGLLCDNNALTELDISCNTELEHLCCYDNALTELDISCNIGLYDIVNIDCGDNVKIIKQ